jgi:predicted aspartyl protease
MSARNSVRALLAMVALATGLMAPGAALSAAPGKCTLARIAEWQIRPARGQPILDGTINGQNVGVLLDTGSSRSAMLRSAADRLGLVRYDVMGNRMIGVGGETVVQMVSIDEFTIGKDVRRNWRVPVIGEHASRSDVAVILGEDFFRLTEIEFDLSHDAVRLYQARDCEGAALAYWATTGAGVVDMDAIFEAAPAIELTVEINGRPVKALLDSGAFASILTKSQAASLGVTPESAGVVKSGCMGGLGEKTVENWTAPFASFRIGDELIRDPKIRFADIWKFSTYKEASLISKRPIGLPDMLLGVDFLRSHRVLVAHSQRRIYFTYDGGTVFQGASSGACDDPSRGDTERKPASSGAN